MTDPKDKWAHSCSVFLCILHHFLCLSFSLRIGPSVNSSLIMKPDISLARDRSTVNYESEDEKQDSDLQLAWSKIMDKGAYKTSSTYTKVEVLILCWNHSCSDMTTKDEIDGLKAVFKEKFNYHAEVQYLDTTVRQRLQVRVNTIVAAFVGEHDGPNTLLIVYYAGHGKPGREDGSLELFGYSAHRYCTAYLLTVIGKHLQMIHRSVWTFLCGTKPRFYCHQRKQTFWRSLTGMLSPHENHTSADLCSKLLCRTNRSDEGAKVSHSELCSHDAVS